MHIIYKIIQKDEFIGVGKMESNKIQEAKEILNKYDIKTISDDKEIIKILDDLMDKKNITKEDEKLLSNIDKYLYTKSKMLESDAAYSCLKLLSERIKIQKVRKKDRLAYQVSLFKATDINGNEHFSLTREYLNRKIENNKDLFGNLLDIEVVPQENSELYELLEIIKKMF